MYCTCVGDERNIMSRPGRVAAPSNSRLGRVATPSSSRLGRVATEGDAARPPSRYTVAGLFSSWRWLKVHFVHQQAVDIKMTLEASYRLPEVSGGCSKRG